MQQHKQTKSLAVILALTCLVNHGAFAANLETASAKTVKVLSNDNAKAKSEHWQLVWQDEFSGEQINLQKWSFEVNCHGGGNDEKQCYTKRAKNAFIENDMLIIQALKEEFQGPAKHDDDKQYSTTDTRTLPYTSARLRSKNKGDWRYGRFEIRAHLPKGQGTWPAIWMLPTDWLYGTWASSGEIDIMEAVNLGAASDAPSDASGALETRVHGTLHYGAMWPDNVYTGTGVKLSNKQSPSDGFHTYAIEWEQGEIRWYIDDIHYATQTSEHWYSKFKDESGQWQKRSSDAPFNERFHLLINFAVGGAWPEKVNETGIDASVFPQRFAIDYVRVYQCSLDINTGQGCATKSESATLVK
ncbi:glycoside hydrolase family 16 protein [Thalassotalea sp. Y01]|uniref:glycoside hydrolase family 16 protein n=1 Tax=Thalassotalea sp. Y01 TaxID=2729613 RepID=UPI00145E0F2C|nr:glycoside hydrolase family 16 protein [Thalassotalea sp. Y01]NMP16367.1 glycoside hydrolase family 16 protein [Thalassotalea sp. Y01]